jgi:GntR family transcriptional regulator, N-acetylglucosamine utilization regulator
LARFRLQLGPVPFYHQVYLDLRGMIEDGRWPAGHQIQPERELARDYGVSLITVRRALDELAREQRIERARGRGTFVLAPRIDRDLDEPLSFNEEMQRRGLDAQTRLIAARPEHATELVASALEIEPGSPTLFVERLRMAEGDPLLLEQAHLAAERFQGLLAADLESASLYQLLSERYGTLVARTRETFEPFMLRSREAQLLGVKPRTPALLVEGVAFSDEGAPVEFSRTFVRGDRTRYFVERTVRVNRNQRRLQPAGRPSTTKTTALATGTSSRGGDER